MALLERESALAALAEYAAEARGGDGRLVLVAGEAGVGKSALVEEFQERAAGRALVLGRLRRAVHAAPARAAVRPGRRARRRAARPVPGRRRRPGRLFDALLRQIDRPGALTVVVVEDVHWADEATLDLLRFLGRRVRVGAGAAAGRPTGTTS